MSKKNRLPLDTRVTRACGFVDFRECISSSKDIEYDLMQKKKIEFSQVCDDYKDIESYYLIYHSETDTPHIHFIFLLKRQVTLSRIINVLSDMLGVDTLAVSVDKLSSLGAHLRYIVHQDKSSISEGKPMYEITDIVSNDSYELIEGYLNSIDDEIDVNILMNIVADCNNEIQVMQRLGLKYYHRYRAEIKTMFDYHSQIREIRNENRDKDLPF